MRYVVRYVVLRPPSHIFLRRVWLVKPKEGLSTPVVFRHLDYDQLARVEPAHLLEQFMEGGLAEAEYVNDLELPAFKAMPSLQNMKAELQVGRTLREIPCCLCCCS